MKDGVARSIPPSGLASQQYCIDSWCGFDGWYAGGDACCRVAQSARRQSWHRAAFGVITRVLGTRPNRVVSGRRRMSRYGLMKGERQGIDRRAERDSATTGDLNMESGR